MENHEFNPRARAIERARAEAQVIDNSHQLTRIKVELNAISRIRSDRLASTAKGVRLRMALVAVAVGIACGSLGYWLRFEPPERVQLHILERDVATAADTQPSFAGASVLVPLEPKSASVLAAMPAVAPAVATNPVPPDLAQVESQLAGPATTPAPVATPVPLPISLPLPVLVSSKAKVALPPVGLPSAKGDSASTHPSNGAQVGKALPMVAERAPDAPNAAPRSSDGIDVVLPNRAPGRPAQSAVAQASTNADYKVVNVIDGAVIVRQGQSVSQIRIGGKMPDGQTLKSVNTDKGQFETLP